MYAIAFVLSIGYHMQNKYARPAGYPWRYTASPRTMFIITYYPFWVKQRHGQDLFERGWSKNYKYIIETFFFLMLAECENQ